MSQMVQSLPGFLDLCLNVCSPSQVLGDVYTEVLEAAHPLHRGPTDHKRSGISTFSERRLQVFPICCYSLAVTAGKRAFGRRVLWRPHPARREVTCGDTDMD